MEVNPSTESHPLDNQTHVSLAAPLTRSVSNIDTMNDSQRAMPGYPSSTGQHNNTYNGTSHHANPQPPSEGYSSPYSQSDSAPVDSYNPSTAPYANVALPPPSNTKFPVPNPAFARPNTTPTPAHTDSHAQPSSHHIMQETEDELTQDELIEYEKGLLTWDKAKNWRFWLRKEWVGWYIAFVLIVVVVALMAFFHHSIINWLSPFVRRLRTLRAGFCIPAAILFVLSFPPLFGNEIVMVLVGLVWGLGKGFAIVAVGIGFGEFAVFLMFKYLCHARAERMTRKSLNYACLAEAVREGGFIMAWVVRLSVIPTHYTTAILAVCGLPTWKFFCALILAMPKQLISVYVGVVLGQTNASTNSHVVSDCVFAACALITLGALWFIYKRMIKVRKSVLISMRNDLKAHNVEVSSSPPEDGADGIVRPANLKG
ncbi:hypothetical protein IAR55_002937 [Kwoniella newhampshirensis]|uniref:Golgi apparatus membrane protein TVP38 n=1 Tax=Kwoniella newhampshirensis TaxID=1651941 RepID=A0AAW0YS63_9TREE